MNPKPTTLTSFWRMSLLASIAVILAVPVTIMVLTYWTIEMPAVPASKLARMRVGMTTGEVKQLLGTPTHDNGPIWQYSRMTWAILNVRFGDDERVADFDHDF